MFKQDAFPGVACPADAKMALPVPLVTPWTKTGENLAEDGRLV
jgi:hypothetical protein